MSVNSRRTFLITGATGSIGSKLRRHFGSSGNLDLRLLCLNVGNDPDVIGADLAEYDDTWARTFENIDVVIHLAGASSTTSSWDVVQRLNIDLSLNVMRAAEDYGARRVVFASSNWVVAGHRFGTQPLTTHMTPAPVNPYGSSKLFLERAGRDWAARTGSSFIALRIGYSQHAAGNLPGPHMEHGVWGQQMWLSDRDLCHGVECAALVQDVPFAILNLMSDNPGMRWDIDTTRQVIGYDPQDGHVAISTSAAAENEQMARSSHEVVLHLQRLSAKW
jgi:NAD+ dependent glucose-6-phosphate dehydrogenase